MNNNIDNIKKALVKNFPLVGSRNHIKIMNDEAIECDVVFTFNEHNTIVNFLKGNYFCKKLVKDFVVFTGSPKKEEIGEIINHFLQDNRSLKEFYYNDHAIRFCFSVNNWSKGGINCGNIYLELDLWKVNNREELINTYTEYLTKKFNIENSRKVYKVRRYE